MTRTFYRCLLRLHPPSFQRRFGEEMLWIFDEASAEGVLALFADAFVSLARQWFLRFGLWKAAAAIPGALIQLTAGGLAWLAAMRPWFASHPASDMPGEISPAIASFVEVALAVVGAIAFMVIALAFWTRRFSSKRLRT